MRLLGIAFSITAALIAGFEIQLAEAATPRACRSQDTTFKNTVRRERMAISAFEREQRTAESLARRLERDLESAARKAQQCQDKVARKRDQMADQLNRMEDQRRRYVSQIAEITAQRIECELEVLSGRYCDPNRFYTQINRLARTITLVETRIASFHDTADRKVALEESKCERLNLRNDQTVARSRSRVEAQAPRVTAKEAAAASATAARTAAENALAACILANPN